MNKEELIKKWLDNDLTAEELKEFQLLEEYESFVKLSDKAQFFKAPDFDSSKAFKKLLPIIDKKRAQKTSLQRLRPIIQISAILVIGIVVYSSFFMNALTTIKTIASQTKSIDLPDASKVELNAMSTISFNKKKWSKKREVTLIGEAYFNVEKGSQFDVITTSGIITVVGTQFNIKNRKDYFEVKCFEGKVNVLYNGDLIPLPAGQTVRVMNKIVFHDKTDLGYPTWMDNFSSFKSVPLFEVIAEFERQYNLIIRFDNQMDMTVLYSGMFVHNNQDMAIQSIAVPFGMDYTIIENVVILNKIE